MFELRAQCAKCEFKLLIRTGSTGEHVEFRLVFVLYVVRQIILITKKYMNGIK